jgi:hypothetical protein
MVEILDKKGRFISRVFNLQTRRPGLIAIRFPEPEPEHEEWLDEFVRKRVVLVVKIHDEVRVYVKTSKTHPTSYKGIHFTDLFNYDKTFVRLDHFLSACPDDEELYAPQQS